MSWCPRRVAAVWVVAALAVGGGARRVAAAEIDWAAVEREATEFLSAYIRIDTTNPPGNETPAARFLAERFRREGIESEVFESAPGRGAVFAVVRTTPLGRATGARPILLLSHIDVVPADPDGWDLPPFSGTVRDGYVYGRGALDCKGPGTVEALATILVRRAGIPLNRDVFFLATPDEEAGGALGAGWTTQHLDKIRGAAFVLNEGGDIHVLPNGKQVYEVAVSEKTPCWLRLTATGEAGHGSTPPAETAVTRLVRALDRLREHTPELRVVPEVAAYYAALSAVQDETQRARFADLRRALEDAGFRMDFLGNPHNAALLHNTITPTVLVGSQKTNVIPRSASADLDCRLLPGEDPDAFVQNVREVIGDPSVRVDTLLNFPPSSSSTDTPLFAALRTLADREGVPLVPSVLTGFTDSHYFREKRVPSYGFVPFALTEEEERREHGVNERMSTANLRDGTRRLLELLQILDTEDVSNGKQQGH